MCSTVVEVQRSTCWLTRAHGRAAQDRSVVIAKFRSESGVSDDQPRSLAAVFDGHKRAEAAVIASELLPKLLAECAPGLKSCLACIWARKRAV
jgi:serine/threonine protein phosphatase PrpC